MRAAICPGTSSQLPVQMDTCTVGGEFLFNSYSFAKLPDTAAGLFVRNSIAKQRPGPLVDLDLELVGHCIPVFELSFLALFARRRSFLDH